MNRKHVYAAVAAVAIVVLAGCGSGGLGDIMGSPNTAVSEIRGTVDHVDLSSRTIYLTNVSGMPSSMLSNSGGGSSVRVYYNDNTRVDYQGNTFRAEDLERGDEVSVRVDDSGNQLLADTVTVTYDATPGGSTSGSTSGSSSQSGGYTSTIRGTVRYVDTSRRTIELQRSGSGQSTIVEYDPNLNIQFNGRTYRVDDLERGDEIDIRVRDYGNGRLVAEGVTVMRSVSGTSGTSSSSSSQSTVRGTVRYVDTSRRTIELEQTDFVSGFNSGSGTGQSIIVSYDTSARVDVQGKLYPVTNLERGDVVEVEVQRSGSSYLAQRIYLMRDANTR